MNILRRIRLRGISTPWGGLSIDLAPDHERRAIESLFSFLEGRRSMHEHLDAEFDHHVHTSLLEIRKRTDTTLQALTRGSRAYVLVERFRDATVAFFSEVPEPITGPLEPMSPPYRQALQKFRLTVGPILAGLEDVAGTQVRGGLATLPRYFQNE